MKTTGKIKQFALAAIIALSVFTLSSVISQAGVQNTRHDLSANNNINPPNIGTFATEQICVFCHTPHGANDLVRQNTSAMANGTFLNTGAATGGSPVYLWNRALTNGAAATYTLYASSSMNAYSGEVRVYSLMCLSCHDGVGALNVMLNPPSGDGFEDQDGDGMPDPFGFAPAEFSSHDQIGDGALNSEPANIGERWTPASGGSDDHINKLSNDHPISIDYTTAHSDVGNGGLKVPTEGGIGGLRLFRNPSGLYTSLECSTCHDVHNEGTSAAGTYPFLAKSNLSSNLCLTCHLK